MPPQSAETVNEYIDRWLEAREDRGLSTVSTDRGRLVKWVLPSIGTTEVAAVTRAQLEALVAKLDRSVLAGDMAWKTAGNVWGLVTKLFDDARKSKRADLRMREDNPADEVQGPDRGERKAKQYLWPSEFLALVTCPHVPARMRRAYVLAVYLYARAGEIKALDWADVDLERGVVHIHKSVNRETGELTTTKSGESRRLPLEKELLPLLTAMHKTAKGKGPVLGLDGTETHLARQLRYHLEVAGVTRAELFDGDANRKAMSFHDLRATGVTWCAARGDDPLRIKQRAGHKSFSTTEIYIREAENLSDAFGAVFPALPASLQVAPEFRSPFRSLLTSSDDRTPRKQAELVEAPGIEAEPGA